MRGHVIAAAALLLCGCIPLPHRIYYAPTISGTVTNAGAPVEGAEMHVSSYLTKRTEIARTDSAGHFSVGPLRTWEFAFWLLGDPLCQYSVDIHNAGRDYSGINVHRMGFARAELAITCDLAVPASRNDSQPEFCRATSNSLPP